MDGVRSGDPTGARVAELLHSQAHESIGCAHMLCRQPATAVLLFDPRVATAWLIDVGGPASSGLPMCAGHSGRFRAPVGWVLSDQRRGTGSVASSDPSGMPESDSVTPGENDAGDMPADDTPPEPEPAPTPLLSRAFRTTAQALI
jgi:hypothetical protein